MFEFHVQALIVSELIECGFVAEHVQRLGQVLGENLRSMCAAINEHIPGAEYTPPRGGYFLFLKLPARCRIDAAELLEITSTATDCPPITFTVGDACVAASDTINGEFSRYFRLSFAFHTAEEITRGVALLGRHIAAHTDGDDT